MIPVSIDESLIEIMQTPEDWRQLPAPRSTREAGTRWVAESRSAVLRVPSIVVDGEFNYVLNPRHTDFARLEIGEPLALRSSLELVTAIVVGIGRGDPPSNVTSTNTCDNWQPAHWID
jgi:RES domain-containing protein